MITEGFSKNTTLRNYKDEIERRIKNDRNKNIVPNSVIDTLMSVDPTPKKAFVLQLLKWYLSGSMRYLEDASKATIPLTLYSKFKNTLDPIQSYDFSELLDLGDKLSDKKSNSEISKEDTQRFFDEKKAVLFYEDSNYKIVIPKTKEAAIYFGRGTRWCTSADDDNYFSEYNKTGPLYIILFKNHPNKWQFHFDKNIKWSSFDICFDDDLSENYSLMDESDDYIDLDIIPDKLKELFKQFLLPIGIQAILNNEPSCYKFSELGNDIKNKLFINHYFWEIDAIYKKEIYNNLTEDNLEFIAKNVNKSILLDLTSTLKIRLLKYIPNNYVKRFKSDISKYKIELITKIEKLQNELNLINNV